MILSFNGNPVNGIDVAKYQGEPQVLASAPDWLWMYAMKATDIAKTKDGGVDPLFNINRAAAAKMNVRWRPIYCFLREPDQYGDMSDQMALFCQTVGRLYPNECLYLDWERSGVTLAHIAEAERVLNVVYPGRWGMYVNDASPDMIRWMENRTVPLMHPDWREEGWEAAEFWEAEIWQVGIAPAGYLPSVFPSVDCDVDWVRKPEAMDRICQVG